MNHCQGRGGEKESPHIPLRSLRQIFVVVGEKAEKYSRTAVQDIWIHYRDIGMLNDVKEEFDIPSMEEFYGMDNGMMFDDELPATI